MFLDISINDFSKSFSTAFEKVYFYIYLLISTSVRPTFFFFFNCNSMSDDAMKLCVFVISM